MQLQEHAQMDEAVARALERGQLVDISTTGRKTGEPRRIEIALHRFDGRLYISGMPDPTRARAWLRNLDAEPRFTLHLKQAVKADLPARARIITDAAERREVLARVARVWNRSDIDNMVAHSPLIEVLLDDGLPETHAA